MLPTELPIKSISYKNDTMHYYVMKEGGQEFGPLNRYQLEGMYKTDALKDCLIRSNGTTEWLPAEIVLNQPVTATKPAKPVEPVPLHTDEPTPAHTDAPRTYRSRTGSPRTDTPRKQVNKGMIIIMVMFGSIMFNIIFFFFLLAKHQSATAQPAHAIGYIDAYDQGKIAHQRGVDLPSDRALENIAQQWAEIRHLTTDRDPYILDFKQGYTAGYQAR